MSTSGAHGPAALSRTRIGFVCITDDPTRSRKRTSRSSSSGTTWRRAPTRAAARIHPAIAGSGSSRRTSASGSGDRFVCLDLDCVHHRRPLPALASVRRLHNLEVDDRRQFLQWVDVYARRRRAAASVARLRSGASPLETKAARLYGSDQAWIAYKLGGGESTWTAEDGVYSFRNELRAARELPPGARIVFFHGKGDPWEDELQRVPWVKRHYR
jgi:hypothetical protein